MDKLPVGLLSAEQQKAITHLFEHDQTLLIAGLGFGKCVVGLTAISELINAGELNRVLVMAPLRVITSTWMPEIAKWGHLNPDLMVSAVGGSDKRKAALKSSVPIVAINFESAKSLLDEARENGVIFDGLLIDELSSLKASGGTLFKVMRRWVKGMRWRAGMTATPVAEATYDIYGQALLLDDGKALGTRIDAFLNRWFIPADFQGYSWAMREGAAKELTQRLRPLIYRVDDSSYLESLPELLDVKIPLPLSSSAQELYSEMSRNSLIERLDVLAPNAAVQAGKLAQIASGGLYRGDDRELIWTDPDQVRLLAVKNYVSKLDDPVIITYQYAYQLEGLLGLYPDAPVLGVGGTCSHSDIEAFNTGSVPVLLGHPKSFGMGLNLQGACRTMIHYSPMYSGDRYRQVIGRIHRRGQSHTVTRVSFYAPGTVEERTISALAKKEHDEAEFMLHVGK